MIERPLYFEHELMPGKPMFRCATLSASMTTVACAARWKAAGPGEACHECALGRSHHQELHPEAPSPQRQSKGVRLHGICARCTRTDLRLIGGALCVSCMNRTYEAIKQVNRKGKPPIKLRLQEVAVPVQMPDGRVEQRLMLVQDDAEAVARVLRGLPDDAKITSTPPRPTSWNAKTKTFEPVCPKCGEAGMLLERQRGGVLQHHCWACEGDPLGSGWDFAPVRRPTMPMHPETVAAVLNGDPSLADEVQEAWGPTAYPCTCGAGQVEGLLTQPVGRWRTRCRACGANSAQEES